MNIGILTHHYVNNFGAYLQADALITTIKALFPEIKVEIIDYRVKKHSKATSIHFFGFKSKRGDSILGYFLKICLFFRHKKNEKNFKLSKQVHSSEEIDLLNYDLVIVGSDEVWNYNDIAYSPIKFGVGMKCRHISYAASAGDSLPKTDDYPAIIKEGLKSFYDISVRDINTERMVDVICGIKVLKVLDPIYLCDFTLNVRKKIKKWTNETQYILIYDCRLNVKQVKSICEYAKKKNLNILGAGEYRKWYSTVETTDITPYEWAYLFKNASLIITGTFHGVAFSIKYNKPFAVYMTEKNRINKVSSLLDDLNLEQQIVNESSDIISVASNKIDYEKINSYLESQIEISKSFLRNNIEKIVEGI